MPRWFLILNGVALLLMGISLLVIRLRERPLYRHVLGITWALLCCAVGVALLLMGKGYLSQPGATPAKGAPAAGRRAGDLEFPSGR
jgi:hypothetical protein